MTSHHPAPDAAPSDPGFETSVDAILAACGIRANPYLLALEQGTMTRADFVATQVQFYYAVVFFSRPMAVLAAKIPGAARRVEILRNVWEEHGDGDASRMHGATFLELLHRLDGLTQQDVESHGLWPELRAFNTALIGCCTLDDWAVGAGCLGIIERAFVDVSRRLGRGIVARGWLPPERMVHYDLHEALDVRHSADFFDVVRPAWNESERGRYLVGQGLQLGAYLFDQLYRGLFAARERRTATPVRWPQPHVYTG